MNITGSLNEMAAARRHSPHGLVDSSWPVWHLSFTTAQGFTTDTTQVLGGWTDATIGTTNDGIVGGGAPLTPLGQGDEVTTAANFSGGAGGRGYRHWRADGDDKNGGGFAIRLYDSGGAATIYHPDNPTAPINEVWFRWYMRYQSGFLYASSPGGPAANPVYAKEVCVNYTSGDGAVPRLCLDFIGAKFGWAPLNPSHTPGYYSTSTTGWPSIMGAQAGDGLWHYYEAYWKTDTNRANGILKTWVDGVLAHEHFDADMLTQGVRFLAIGNNSSYPSNSGVEMYTDYDEIAVSRSGPIGPYDSARGY